MPQRTHNLTQSRKWVCSSRMYVCMYVCMYTRCQTHAKTPIILSLMYACMYMYTYIYTHTWIYIHTHINTHRHTQKAPLTQSRNELVSLQINFSVSCKTRELPCSCTCSWHVSQRDRCIHRLRSVPTCSIFLSCCQLRMYMDILTHTTTCKINGNLPRFSTADLYQIPTGTPSERFSFVLRVAVHCVRQCM